MTSGLFLAPDAHGSATIWRANPDRPEHPTSLLHQGQADPEVWAILSAVIDGTGWASLAEWTAVDEARETVEAQRDALAVALDGWTHAFAPRSGLEAKFCDWYDPDELVGCEMTEDYAIHRTSAVILAALNPADKEGI